MLKVDPHTVLNWAKAGIIPEAFRVGRTVRFSRDAVNASLDLNNAGEGRYVEMTSLALKCMLGIDYARMPWCADITYVPMPSEHAFLCAVMDRHTRKVLGWALSNTMDTGLCLEALKQVLETAGRVPEIFNTDQGSQFTSAVDRSAGGIGSENQHGRAGPLDGQRLH